jgi:AcrR family transcriptional regulator
MHAAMRAELTALPINDRAGARDGRRELILEAAIAEFGEKGFAGGRIDAIARRSQSNQQLIYYYFESKRGLYRAVLERMMEGSHEYLSEHRATTFAGAVRQHAARARSDDGEAWQRFWTWEALEGRGRDIAHEERRRRVWETTIDEVRRGQAAGEVADELDPAMVALALQSILILPRLLPQLTKLIAGSLPDDPAFARREDTFLEQLLARLAPEHGVDRAG